MNHHSALGAGAPAMKHDAGKLPLHLVDPQYLEMISQVLAHGQAKYGAWNWAAGTFDWSRLYSAALRHLNAFWGGEDLDPETGLPHLAHASCMLMFLSRYHRDGWGQDDRFRFDQVRDKVGAPAAPAPKPNGEEPRVSFEELARSIDAAHANARQRLEAQRSAHAHSQE